MKKSRFSILLFVGPLLAVAAIFFFINADQDSKLNSEISLQEDSADRASGLATDAERSVDMQTASPQTESMNPEALVADFSYITPEYLEAHWEEELGCFDLLENGDSQCEYPELTASSYEESIWMIENGYPPASVLKELKSLSEEQLESLSRSNRHYWLPPLILAQRYADTGDRLLADRYFLKSRARNLNPYGLVMQGKSLITAPDPDAQGWSYRTAAVQFKKAALLGDYAAQQLLHELYNSYWNGNPGLVVSTGITETAFLELSAYFGLPINQWPVEERPKDG